MRLIQGTTRFTLDGEYAIAIGKFDGIHLGHQKLIDKILQAKSIGYKSAVFTFDPSPVAFFGDGTYKGLTTKDEKRRIFDKLGVDVLIEYPLDYISAAITPEDFISDILVKKMHAKMVVCGPDFTFGNKGMGNVNLLKQHGGLFGFDVQICEKVSCDGIEISSSLIREELEAGQIEIVNNHIGALYSITGIVKQGRQIGRTINLPTVNLIPDEDKLLPPAGVYKAKVSYKGKKYLGITNIGIKPTVTDEGIMTVETHIFDFDMNIYGEQIIVNLLTFIRPERRFESTQQLRLQIQKDIAIAMNS